MTLFCFDDTPSAPESTVRLALGAAPDLKGCRGLRNGVA